jgi:hypothetical protein
MGKDPEDVQRWAEMGFLYARKDFDGLRVEPAIIN